MTTDRVYRTTHGSIENIELADTGHTTTDAYAENPSIPPWIAAGFAAFMARKEAAKRADADKATLRETMRKLDAAISKLEQRQSEQAQARLRELFGLDSEPGPTENRPDKLRQYILGDDAELGDDSLAKHVLGHVPPKNPKRPYRQMTEQEIAAQAKKTPWREARRPKSKGDA